jgi:ATP-dependent DNA helicase RecG
MNWDNIDIKKEIALGEDSTRQFKVQLDSATKLAEEMCAFSNSRGGIIYVGVADDGEIKGLTQNDIGKYNQLISNTANDILKPAIYPLTKTANVDGKLVLLINITSGAAKPYCISSGVYYVKSGSDKRKASPQELLRMFQQSASIFIDETIVDAKVENTPNANGVNLAKFYFYYEKRAGKTFLSEGISVEKVLENMNLAKEGNWNLAGLLLFANNPQTYKPFCLIRCISFFGNNAADNNYKDRKDAVGTIEDQYLGAMAFLNQNLRTQQQEGSFNQIGKLEISKEALEEAIINALLHRDYSKNAVIRLFIFEDRVEIVSPGSLPNHLTIENIMNYNSVSRNNIIVSHAIRIIPYTGVGTGIARILKNHPNTKFIDDKDGEQFTIVLNRVIRS